MKETFCVKCEQCDVVYYGWAKEEKCQRCGGNLLPFEKK